MILKKDNLKLGLVLGFTRPAGSDSWLLFILSNFPVFPSGFFDLNSLITTN